MKLLLFDLDLTLVSTGGAGLRALRTAFEQVLGFGDALDGLVPDGKTDPAILREACLKRGVKLESPVAERILERYVHFLRLEVQASRNYRVLPGVKVLLDECRARGDVCLGLATGNVETGARIKLEPSGLNTYFSFGGFGSDSEDRTELVRMAARKGEVTMGISLRAEDTFVIGDTPRDIEAGRRAGFQTVGVATGHHSVDVLKRAGAHLVVPDLDQGRDQFVRSARMV